MQLGKDTFKELLLFHFLNWGGGTWVVIRYTVLLLLNSLLYLGYILQFKSIIWVIDYVTNSTESVSFICCSPKQQ